MANLTEILNQNSVVSVINNWYEDNYQPRTTLGLSEIGHQCHRYLWYIHNGYTKGKSSGQKLRLFEFGKSIESLVIKDLINAGYQVHSQQEEIFFELNGIKLYGHIDGKIEGLSESKQTHVLEIKSCNDKAFKSLLKIRSYEQWQPKYKGQIQVYMLGCELKRALTIVYNKNTSEMYSERIRLDKEYAVNLLSDVFQAIGRKESPLRLCPKAEWYEAKWCDFYKECFQK